MRTVILAAMLAIGGLAQSLSVSAADVRMYVRHEVADYAVWRKSYDAFAETQRKFGVKAQAVFRSVDDTNDVTVTHDFASVEKAKAFAASPELKAAMEKSGVKGMPQIWYTTVALK